MALRRASLISANSFQWIERDAGTSSYLQSWQGIRGSDQSL